MSNWAKQEQADDGAVQLNENQQGQLSDHIHFRNRNVKILVIESHLTFVCQFPVIEILTLIMFDLEKVCQRRGVELSQLSYWQI